MSTRGPRFLPAGIWGLTPNTCRSPESRGQREARWAASPGFPPSCSRPHSGSPSTEKALSFDITCPALRAHTRLPCGSAAGVPPYARPPLGLPLGPAAGRPALSYTESPARSRTVRKHERRPAAPAIPADAVSRSTHSATPFITTLDRAPPSNGLLQVRARDTVAHMCYIRRRAL